MNTQNHISDQDLRLVLDERETSTSQDTIEQHVASCSKCQNRLLDLAADASWRGNFSSNIAVLASQSAFEETNTRSISSGAASFTTDEFDRQTIDKMLGQVLQPPSHPEMMGRLGRYEVEKVIGCGGMGVVMRAFDRELHRPVAIKIIRPRLAHNGTAKQRFLREAKAAAAVLHPNVIAIHDISESEGVPWFVMPLVVGPTLRDVVQETGPLPAKDVVRIGIQIAAGLSAAHSQGLVHRDIKPANVLVDNQVNRIVITDFGLARREAEESMTQTGMVAGTLNYMSPEQSRGEDVDARSDLFSLGSLLYFLATGVMPFRSSAPMGVIHKIGNEAHPNPQTTNSEVPSGLASAIDRLLEKQAEDRFQSAGEVELWFSDYLAHLNQPAKAVMPRMPAKPVSQKNVFAIDSIYKCIAFMLVSAASLAVLWSVLTRPNPAVPLNSPKPMGPAAAVIWSNIQTKYRIESSEVFESDLKALEIEFRQTQTPRVAMDPDAILFIENRFDSDVQKLQQRFKTFSLQMDLLAPVAPE